MEEHVVLRLPPNLAAKLKEGMAGGPKPKMDFQMSENGRTGTFLFDDEKYACTLVDLPNLVETYKTTDKRSYYKSADVAQMLVIHPLSTVIGNLADGFVHPSGLTPPMHNVYNKRKPKHEEISQAELKLTHYVRRGALGSQQTIRTELVDADEFDKLYSEYQHQQKEAKEAKKAEEAAKQRESAAQNATGNAVQASARPAPGPAPQQAPPPADVNAAQSGPVPLSQIRPFSQQSPSFSLGSLPHGSV